VLNITRVLANLSRGSNSLNSASGLLFFRIWRYTYRVSNETWQSVNNLICLFTYTVIDIKDFFSGSSPVWFIQKRLSKKSSIIVKNAWEQRMFTTMQKQGRLIFKTSLAIFNMKMHKMSLLCKRLRLGLIFTRLWTFFLFFSSDIFSSGL